ncbi:hypothetical protein CAEBREN_25341 [Caenorhabditis brenneri]|uniref:Uncharacterized protein n=1 Tax=Caenorhabditis brenneri TaxID=135651 RepID=G0N358_CAEBE|nr:hypothetical protein CAEBREN_25341 [Caenorhabditis brenneri]
MNHEREKDIAIFLFFSYSYKTVKLSHGIICIIICANLFMHFFGSQIGAFILASFAWLLFMMCEANQLLLSIIAVQRVLLYFLPSHEKHLQLSGTGMKTLFYLFPILNTCVTVYLILKVGEETFLQIHLKIVVFKFIDAFSLPLVIELTYIGSNRRNLLTALSSLESWRGFRSVCCPWIMTTQVEPVNNLAMVSSTNMELRSAVQN